jgi:hypothetical protein
MGWTMGATEPTNEKLYTKLTVSIEDLTLARRAARKLLASDWDFGPVRGAADYWEHAAFTCAMVVSYGRVFTTSNGMARFPDDLLNYTQAEETLHKELKRLRDKQYAHSDAVSQEVRFSPSPVAAVHKLPSYSLPREQLKCIDAMLGKVIENVEKRLAEVHAALIAAS